MRTFLDTSVLVAAHERTHVHHAQSVDLLSRSTQDVSFCAAHSLAEVYSVLTRMPVRPRISPEQALLFLGDVQSHLTIVALDEADYIRTLEEAANEGVVGGQIYDRLLLECARRVDAETINTWNVRHFQRLAPDLADRIRTP